MNTSDIITAVRWKNSFACQYIIKRCKVVPNPSNSRFVTWKSEEWSSCLCQIPTTISWGRIWSTQRSKSQRTLMFCRSALPISEHCFLSYEIRFIKGGWYKEDGHNKQTILVACDSGAWTSAVWIYLVILKMKIHLHPTHQTLFLQPNCFYKSFFNTHHQGYTENGVQGWYCPPLKSDWLS